jgi:predicted esterase
MKLKTTLCVLLLVLTVKNSGCQQNILKLGVTSIDYVAALKDTLSSISEVSENDFFRLHCNSILAVINSRSSLGVADSAFLTHIYEAFTDEVDSVNAGKFSTYLHRRRPLIISWVSPADGAVSFSWLTLPKDWNPENTYPMYVNLHGLWNVAADPIEYMSYPYMQVPSHSASFEDGYLLSPWGRGNLWYEGISLTDIWECMDALENVAQIDPDRKYLSGHSMGGYGAWSIASNSPGTWAAVGIMAGALQYKPVVNKNTAKALRNVPAYFVCGTEDGLLKINKSAYNYLQDAGNPNLKFVTFNGGHEYLEENVLNMYLWMKQFVRTDLPTGLLPAGEIANPGISCTPNPVSSVSNIVFSGKDNSLADIGIYDMGGRLMDEVVKGFRISGEQTICYDASGLKPGIYLLRMKSGDRIDESRMVVIH